MFVNMEWISFTAEAVKHLNTLLWTRVDVFKKTLNSRIHSILKFNGILQLYTSSTWCSHLGPVWAWWICIRNYMESRGEKRGAIQCVLKTVFNTCRFRAGVWVCLVDVCCCKEQLLAKVISVQIFSALGREMWDLHNLLTLTWSHGFISLWQQQPEQPHCLQVVCASVSISWL